MVIVLGICERQLRGFQVGGGGGVESGVGVERAFWRLESGLFLKKSLQKRVVTNVHVAITYGVMVVLVCASHSSCQRIWLVGYIWFSQRIEVQTKYILGDYTPRFRAILYDGLFKISQRGLGC